MKRIFICSRYAGDVAKNEEVAERLCRKVTEEGHAPFAPHLFYTRFLDDNQPQERDLGRSCALTFLAVCEEVRVYTGDGISSGMKTEIEQAQALGLPIVWFDEI